MSWYGKLYETNNRAPSNGDLDRSRYSRSDPPNPHHRACDDALASSRHPNNDELDISTYINEQWSYYQTLRETSDKENRSEHNDGGRDRLQFRVEAHLTSMFPSSAGYFSSGPALDNEDRFCNDQGGVDGNESSRNNDQNQPTMNKAAHFFHPRPLAFFSPLLPTNDQSIPNDEYEGHDRLRLTSNVNASSNNPEMLYGEEKYVNQSQAHAKVGERADSQQESFHDPLSQSHNRGNQCARNVHVSNHQPSQHPYNGRNNKTYTSYASGKNDIPTHPKHHHKDSSQHSNEESFLPISTNPTYGNTGNDQSPPVQQSPRDLFQVKENIPAATEKSAFSFLKLSSKSAPAQSTLTQNSKTGMLSFEKFSATPAKKVNKTWDDINNGGRAVANVQKTKQSSKVNDSKKKPAKKKSCSKDEGQSEVENLLSSMHRATTKNKNSKKRSSDENSRAGKVSKRSKQKSLDEEMIAQQVPTTKSTKTSAISMEDLAILEQANILNAAACEEGLRVFLETIGRKQYVSWTMLFLDKYYAPAKDRSGRGKKKDVHKSGKFDLPQEHQGYKISTAFFPANKKYCTEKGPPCTNWNCVCDSQIRAKRATASLMGAMFLFKDGDKEDDDAKGETESIKCYILPLAPTATETLNTSSITGPVYPRMSGWPSIPFDCSVPVQHRWTALKAILASNKTKLVTYNATVSLLPLYHHLIHDTFKSKRNVSMFNEYMTYLSSNPGQSRDEQRHEPLAADACLYSIWDLRLVQWMLRPNVSPTDLEYESIKEGFSHLIPESVPDEELSILELGLIEAKRNLALLNNVYPKMNHQLVHNDLSPALERIEAPVQSILAAMECRGIAFNPKKLQRVRTQIEDQVQQFEEQGRGITNNPNFLLSSPQQVSKYLFDVLKISIPAGLVNKGKQGSNHRSTSVETLEAIKAESGGNCHPIIDLILSFRSANKMLTTYILPLPAFCYKEYESDYRPKIHPQWTQTVARTGRLSCRQPNLQQVPKDSSGADPRKAFVTSKGKTDSMLFACDYSQKEVRILAHMCQDQALRSLFTGDKKADIYKQMAAIIRNKPIETVTADERAQFKQVTLAILYGMSPKQVSKKLDITVENAKRMMQDFYRKFCTLKKWMDETKELARRNYFVTTIAGRRRYLDAINSDDHALKSQAERQAINTVIQGSAADMMKTAMINMNKNIRELWKGPVNERPQMLLQIHDELVLEVNYDEKHVTWLKEIAVKSCCRDCETIFGLTVPLVLDCTCGFTWSSKSMVPVGSANG